MLTEDDLASVRKRLEAAARGGIGAPLGTSFIHWRVAYQEDVARLLAERDRLWAAVGRLGQSAVDDVVDAMAESDG